MVKRGLIGEDMVGEGLLTPYRLEHVLREQENAEAKIGLGEMAIKMGLVDEERLVSFLASHFHISHLKLSEVKDIDPDVVTLIPEQLARGATLIAVFKEETTLTIAMADPLDIIALDNIRMSTGYEVRRAISPRDEIKAAIEQYYP